MRTARARDVEEVEEIGLLASPRVIQYSITRETSASCAGYQYLTYNFFGFSVKRFSLPSRKRTKLVSVLCCDLRNPACTQMIDGTENPKIPSKFAKRAARYNKFWQ